MDKKFKFLKEIHQGFQICTLNSVSSNFQVLDLLTLYFDLEIHKKISTKMFFKNLKN